MIYKKGMKLKPMEINTNNISNLPNDFMHGFNLFFSNIPHTLIIALVAMIILDYITGLLRALYERKANSKTHYKGVIKKISLVLVVVLAAISDIILSDGMPIFTTIVTLLAIAGEGLSIVENLGVMGAPIPKVLTDRLEQIRNSEEIDSNVVTKEPDTNEIINDKNIKINKE